MRFDGSSAYVRLPNPPISLAGELTIEMWVNVSLDTRQTLISKSYAREFELTLEKGGRLNFYQGQGSGKSYEGLLSQFNAVAANKWQHVVVTRSEHIPRIQEAQASAYHALRELVELVEP